MMCDTHIWTETVWSGITDVHGQLEVSEVGTNPDTHI